MGIDADTLIGMVQDIKSELNRRAHENLGPPSGFDNPTWWSAYVDLHRIMGPDCQYLSKAIIQMYRTDEKSFMRLFRSASTISDVSDRTNVQRSAAVPS